jgi:hypothetical protein
MIQLTTNISDPLLELIQSDKAPIDGVEVGPWLSLRQILEYRKILPQMPFYFHGGDLINRVGVIPGAISIMAAYLRCTESPWLSLHITMWLPGLIWLIRRRGWRIPPPNPDRATHRFIRQVRKLTLSIRVPVILENPDPLPSEDRDFQVEAGRIARVLDETKCGLLLDTGHALVTAERLGLDVRKYVSGLPLDRVAQVHVSGPRMRGGRLEDAHESLQENDYTLLGFVLARPRPRVVTLEYIHGREALREQLFRLREILESHASMEPVIRTSAVM